MSGTGGGYMTETDPDDGSEPPLLPVAPSLPEGIANSRDNPPPRLRDVRSAPVEEPFEIVETDENFNPLDQNGQRQEPRLSEIDAGPRSLVERQAAEDAADQAAGRPPRLRTRQERRQAQRDGRDRTMQELTALRRQNEELTRWKEQTEPMLASIEPRLQEIDQGRVADQLAQYDRGITEAQSRATAARRAMSEAMVSQDGEAMASALEQRDAAIMEQQRLTVQRNMLATGNPLGNAEQGQQPRQGQPRQQPQPQPQPQQRPPLPARAQALADDFASRHDWVSRQQPGDDRWAFERDTVLRLDNEVARDGYDPSGLEYWEVLEDRMRQYLPHRFEDANPAPAPRRNGDGNGQRRLQAPPPERRGPMVAGGGAPAPQGGGNKVYVSPARKDAMIQAGALGRDGVTVENEVKFRRLMKSYQEFDRANGTVRQ